MYVQILKRLLWENCSYHFLFLHMTSRTHGGCSIHFVRIVFTDVDFNGLVNTYIFLHAYSFAFFPGQVMPATCTSGTPVQVVDPAYLKRTASMRTIHLNRLKKICHPEIEKAILTRVKTHHLALRIFSGQGKHWHY